MDRKTQYKHRAQNVSKLRQRHKAEELGKIVIVKNGLQSVRSSDDTYFRDNHAVLFCVHVV